MYGVVGNGLHAAAALPSGNRVTVITAEQINLCLLHTPVQGFQREVCDPFCPRTKQLINGFNVWQEQESHRVITKNSFLVTVGC